MKTTATQQEILLIIDTTFSYRQWCRVDNFDSASNLSEVERLEEACWNGLLNDALPEIYDLPSDNKISYLWSVRRAASFVELELGEYPADKEKDFSINPYSFLERQNFN